MESREHRVGKAVAAQLKEQIKDKPHRADPKNMEQLVKNQGSAGCTAWSATVWPRR